MTEPILKVEHLKKYFPVRGGLFSKKNHVKAVDDISFEIRKGETLGIVGESGCGKSTAARLITQLVRPTSGSVIFKGRDLAGLNAREIRKERKAIQMVFQDPYTSLDPRKTVKKLIMEPLQIHGIGTKQEREQKVHELLEVVGLSAEHGERYPHEFSGGQRQRINIARAVALNPDVLICDEPVSALDVSIQAQVINLLKDLQKQFQLTYVFIAHDLDVVEYVSDRIAVMYLGKIVEMGTYEDVYRNPQHPYTRALLSSTPKQGPSETRKQTVLSGDVPSPMNPPSGCYFHTRCPFATEKCKSEEPSLREYHPNHTASCHYLGQI